MVLDTNLAYLMHNYTLSSVDRSKLVAVVEVVKMKSSCCFVVIGSWHCIAIIKASAIPTLLKMPKSATKRCTTVGC